MTRSPENSPYDLPAPGSDSWDQALDGMAAGVEPPLRPLLFPLHFLKATFPAMGGRVVAARTDGGWKAAGLLFPRGICGGQREYLLRLVPGQDAGCREALRRWTDSELSPDRVQVYDPAAAQEYVDSHQIFGEFDVGAPSQEEAAAVRDLQHEIWQSGDAALYPSDIHSAAFGAGASLVARRGGRVVAFLFGFYRFGGADHQAERAAADPELGIESQLLGVHPSVRRSGLGWLLKTRQAEQARRQGINLIHWTADPLQFPNAVLNYSRLGAAAGRFYPDYYPVRNALNQVRASRFGVTWLLDSARVRQKLAAAEDSWHSVSTEPARLSDFGEPVTLDCGCALPAENPVAPVIAMEIPANWTALQQSSPEAAVQWRESTDALFARLVGWEPGRYVVVDAAAEGDRRYLVARLSSHVLADLERERTDA